MKDKGHFYISLAKSVIRIFGCLLSWKKKKLSILAAGLAAAELLGIAEEVFDKR